MAYDAQLSARILNILPDGGDVQEKWMFGGVGYLINGNMACGVHGDNLIVRVGVETYEWALKQPFTRPFDLTGKPMKGWLYIDPAGLQDEMELKKWVEEGIKFALSLPKK